MPDNSAARAARAALLPLLTEAEAAALLNIAPRTLRALRSAGLIRHVRPCPRKICYREDDLADYIERQSRQERAPCPSTNPPKAATGISISSTKVVGITALRDARRGAMQNGTKPKSGARPRSE
jgi:excisionase family DNA binding protein